MRMLIIAQFLLAVVAICGCASPLKSDDPATRTQAVAELSDAKELMFIAMNIGVYIGQQSGSYCNAFLTKEDYAEDVRVAAVNRLDDTASLLKCATWQDGDVYFDSGMEQGRLEYMGGDYYVHDSASRLEQTVASGDAVRNAAIKRLSTPDLFDRLADFLEQFNESDSLHGKATVSLRTALFPREHSTSVGNKGTSFTDMYGSVRKNNPLDLALSQIVLKQDCQSSIRRFLVASRVNGPSIYPAAMLAAADKLDKSDPASLATTYRRLFCEESKNSNREVPDELAIKMYRLLDERDADVVLAALRRSKPSDVSAIIGAVTDQKVYAGVFCYDKFYEFVTKSNQTSLYCPLDVIKTDVKLNAAKTLLVTVSDNTVLSEIALKAPLFNVRYAAIEQMDDDVRLSAVALDTMKDCPYDTSAERYDLISNRIEWWQRNERQSALKLRKLAISRIKDPTMLKCIRSEGSSIEIKQATSERLASLGYSDVQEIIAAERYDASLFTMLNEMHNANEQAHVAKSAKLKGVRVMAANGLSKAERVAICKKEIPDKSDKAPEGRLTIGNFYLGMNIEDAFAILSLCFPDIKPRIYLDDKALCVADATGRDLIWANLSSLEVHWITLPPTLVRRIVGFKSGTFTDLGRKIETHLGISFSPDLISKGNVSQRIGNYENVDGETLRYFCSAIGCGEDFKRSVRKAINQHTIDYEPLNGGLGAAFANALEDAMQSDENFRDARSPRFAPQGSIQLQWTKNATKGEWNSSGGSSSSGLGTLRQTSSELESLSSQLEGALNQLNNLSL